MCAAVKSVDDSELNPYQVVEPKLGWKRYKHLNLMTFQEDTIDAKQ